MEQFRLEKDYLKIVFNPDTGIGTVTYHETLTPQITAEAYHWFIDHAELVALIKGWIFDFRQVQKFEQGNFQAIKRESRETRQEVDISHIPVALIVGTLYQEQMVKVASKITGQEKRIQLVYTEEEALKFFREWQKVNGEPDDAVPIG
jgi:hypothetical protein